jgi:hypothetical protein
MSTTRTQRAEKADAEHTVLMDGYVGLLSFVQDKLRAELEELYAQPTEKRDKEWYARRDSIIVAVLRLGPMIIKAIPLREKLLAGEEVDAAAIEHIAEQDMEILQRYVERATAERAERNATGAGFPAAP